MVGIFRAGGETRFGLLTDVISQYVFIVPTVVLCGLVWKLPFITTYILMLVADDVSKLAITLPYYKTMRWIKPIQQTDRLDREEALVESGNDPAL